MRMHVPVRVIPRVRTHSVCASVRARLHDTPRVRMHATLVMLVMCAVRLLGSLPLHK